MVLLLLSAKGVRREKGEEQMNPHLQEILHNITTRLAALEQSQKKEWQGLTDEEINELCVPSGFGRGSMRFNLIVQAIEAKLKEKNT